MAFGVSILRKGGKLVMVGLHGGAIQSRPCSSRSR
jgi:hypothetical protein